MRLLTFDWYPDYVDLLCRIGHDWDVAPGHVARRSEPWRRARALPPNATPVSRHDMRQKLARAGYDVAVCHTFLDLALVAPTGVPTVTVVHTMFELEQSLGATRDAIDRLAGEWLTDTRLVFVSAGKKRSWNRPGSVIEHGVPVEEYGPYEGDRASILAVADATRELPPVHDVSVFERTIAGLPLTLHRSHQTPAPAPRPRDDYRHCRVFLNVTRAPFEDGYTFATLEAMASGMPTVTLQHESSPVVHERCGFAHENDGDLRSALLALLENRDLADRLGRQARQLIAKEFAFDRFVIAWREELSAAAGHHDASIASHPAHV